MSEFDISKSLTEESERETFILYALNELGEITEEEVADYANRFGEMDEEKIEDISQDLIENAEKPNKVNNMVNYFMWHIGAFSKDYSNKSTKIRHRIDDIQLINQYDDKLKENMAEIELSLEENLHRANKNISYENLITTLSGIIHEIGEPPIRRLIIKSIFNLTEEQPDILSETISICSIDEGIEEFIRNLHIKYQAEIKWAKAYDQQGQNFIKNHTVDLALRNHNKSPGINHKFNINDEGVINITTNLNQSIELILGILEAEIESIEEFGPRAKRNITPELIETVTERFETFKQKYEEETEEVVGEETDS